MKVVKVEIKSEDQNDTRAVSVMVEQNRGGALGWVRGDGRDVTTNGGVEEFRLKEGQRLVIDAYPQEAAVYDRDQGAAVYPSLQKSGAEVADKSNENDTTQVERMQQEKDRREKEAKQNAGQNVVNPEPESSPEAARPKGTQGAGGPTPTGGDSSTRESGPTSRSPTSAKK